MDPSILSSISGQFSKSLILGTLLPAIVFVVLCLLFVVPLMPYEWRIFERLMALDSTAVVGVSFVTIILAGLLYASNSIIIRFYEGYLWEFTWFGQWRIKHYQGRLQSAKAFMANSMVMRNELRRRKNQKYLGKLEAQRRKYGLEINNEFPNVAALVLPTRLGNMIRSSETYPTVQYNMAGVTLWSRLRSKIDKDYSAALDDAKTPFDFSVNCSFLSAVLALLILVCGLLFPFPLASRSAGVWWGIKILFFCALSYGSYWMAVRLAQDWGRMFRGAFDLFRWDLLKQLGYQQLPATMNEERALWGTISRQVIYGDPPNGRLMEQYGASQTFAYGYLNDRPFMSDLRTARGVSLPDAQGVVTVTLRVKNADAQKRTLEQVVVRDTLPEGFDYLWGKADSTSKPLAVSGANPYFFETGDLAYDDEVTVTYCIAQRAKS